MICTCKPRKILIYINTARKTIAQVKAETGCDSIINGGLFDGAFRPVCHLKANGTVYAKDQYTYWGYGWNDNDIKMISDYSAYKNYICCVDMVRNGQAEKMYYNADMGGARQRTAIGLFADGRMWIYCDKTGKTPEQLQQIALSAGLESAIMLDGGGSTQGIFPGGTVTSSRIVHNFICVWADSEPQKGSDKKMKICIDPGHGGTENYNASPDKTYYEHEFTLDTAQRLQKLLAPHMDITMTRKADQAVSLSNRASIANMAKVNAFISIHSNATSGSGWQSPRGLCVYIYAAGREREKLARALIAAFKAAGIILHGNQIYYNPALTVLAQTTMPAVLIEYGFHTNQDDVALLKTSAYRDKLALATAKGICDYFGISFKAPDEAQPNADAGSVIDQLIAAGISLKELLKAIADKV